MHRAGPVVRLVGIRSLPVCNGSRRHARRDEGVACEARRLILVRSRGGGEDAALPRTLVGPFRPDRHGPSLRPRGVSYEWSGIVVAHPCRPPVAPVALRVPSRPSPCQATIDGPPRPHAQTHAAAAPGPPPVCPSMVLQTFWNPAHVAAWQLPTTHHHAHASANTGLAARSL